ncbi:MULTISPECIES: hypothetical protein [unclassified Janthinobacterium]|uniref:hypothetical protein n=1 Tax=unclassified Janthinobacterium TaxID=2610881 RepID=UPI002588430C|nr:MULTISPECIES: hypothetical protein [unclassified Janthinobacterium]MCX7290107.1 hypothetical protein [Janthinobacterium sp.]MED5595220.1 hypothetical protein [Janthinobacterium sp. P210006]
MSAPTLYPSGVAMEQAMLRVFEGMRAEEVRLGDFQIFTAENLFCVCVLYREDVDIERYARDGTTEEVKWRFLDRLLASREQFSFLELPAVDFRFDSQENLDKNYHGSYYLYLR